MIIIVYYKQYIMEVL